MKLGCFIWDPASTTLLSMGVPGAISFRYKGIVVFIFSFGNQSHFRSGKGGKSDMILKDICLGDKAITLQLCEILLTTACYRLSASIYIYEKTWDVRFLKLLPKGGLKTKFKVQWTVSLLTSFFYWHFFKWKISISPQVRNISLRPYFTFV